MAARKSSPTSKGARAAEGLTSNNQFQGRDLNFETVSDDTIVKAQVADGKLVGERRSQLVATAIELFSRKGYHATTVKEIADLAQVSPGLVYHYFGDKEDILFLSLQVVVHSINRVIPPAIDGVDHPVTKFAVAFAEYCKIVNRNRHAVELTYRETKSLRPEYRDALKQMEVETNAIIKRCLDECVRRGLMRDINTDVFVYQVITSAQTWALKNWRLAKMMGIEEYTRIELDLLLNAALTKAGWTSYLKDTSARQLTASLSH